MLEDALGSLADLGLEALVFLRTPGHSPGHLVWLFASDRARVMLAGDALAALTPRLRLGAATAGQVRGMRGQAASPVPGPAAPAVCLRQRGAASTERPRHACLRRWQFGPSSRCPLCQPSRWQWCRAPSA